MTTMFSEQVKFLPWVGTNYGTNENQFGSKILVVGESLYCPEEKAQRGIVGSIVEDYIKNREGVATDNAGGWMKTYLKFERALVNATTDPEESRKIWDSIAFYNYLQVPMDGARVSGTYEQYQSAQKPFLEVVKQLMPDMIIVWGVGKMYDYLPDEYWEPGKEIVYDGYPIKNGYYNIDGHSSKVIFIYHPSASFSWDWWHEAIKLIQGDL